MWISLAIDLLHLFYSLDNYTLFGLLNMVRMEKVEFRIILGKKWNLKKKVQPISLGPRDDSEKKNCGGDRGQEVLYLS